MKKIKYVIPYIALLLITPIYNLLNIAFNANDFRYVFYSVLAVILTIISVKISREVTANGTRVLYCGSVLVINALFCMGICRASTWN